MMVTDPRIGLTVSLGISVAAAAWLVVQFVFDAELSDAFGTNRYFVTYLAIVALVSSLAAALVFAQFHRVRSDLLAGRNVLAEWNVDRAMFTQVAGVAEREDHLEKRGALILILALTALIFSGFALADPEAASGMAGIGVAFSVLIIAAFFYGKRVRRIHMQFRSGRIVVGRDGVTMNGTLHVWAIPLTWLVGAEVVQRPPATLVITYAFLARFGLQSQTIVLPVPEQALPLAQRAARELIGTRQGARSASA